MKPETFATHTLHPRDQLEAWREWYSSVFEVTPKDPGCDGFSGETRLWNLGGFAISRTSASPVDVVRTKGHLGGIRSIIGSSAIARAARTLP